MKSSRRPAFLMADSLVALFIILLSINFAVLNQRLLAHQERVDQQHLAAVRLDKESSDQYQLSHQRVQLSRGPMIAEVTRHSVVVRNGHQQVLQVNSL